METVKKLYTELDELVESTGETGLKKCYQEYQHHLISLLAPEFKTPLLYRELKTLRYNYDRLGQTFLLPIIKSLANNCAEYIEGDLIESTDIKDEFQFNYVKSIEIIIKKVQSL